MHEGSSAAVAAMFIPIVAIIMGIGIAMLAIYLDFRKKSETLKHYHAERMAAIEKGIELPPLPDTDKVPRPMLVRRRPAYVAMRNAGLTLLFLGAAVTLALWATAEGRAYFWGLVIVALGAAQLLAAYWDARELRGSLSGHRE